MKVVQFKLPVSNDQSIYVQNDELPHFYEHLHRHNEIQITWVIRGEGTLVAGNIMQPFQPGNVFVLGSNQPHLFKSDPVYFDPGNKKTIHSSNIFFNTEGTITTLLDFPEMIMIKKFVQSTHDGLKASETNEKVVSEHIGKVKNNVTGYRFAAFIELLQLMADLTDWKYLSTDAFMYAITEKDGLRMNDIYQYTIANYTEHITLEKIAEVVFLSPQSFCRYFKKHTLKTYTEFLNEVRINEACKKLIGENFQSISAVAYQTGFINVVTFNRVFRDIMGKSPREYIKQYHAVIQRGVAV